MKGAAMGWDTARNDEKVSWITYVRKTIRVSAVLNSLFPPVGLVIQDDQKLYVQYLISQEGLLREFNNKNRRVQKRLETRVAHFQNLL
jgi:hypothetical protein